MDKFSPLLSESDKVFWHQYIPFYTQVLSGIEKTGEFDILEVGVYNAQSIRLWRSLYPNAKITGCDLNTDPTWFKDERIYYRQFDQSNLALLTSALASLEDPVILVDDGSHIPFHQLIFLDAATSAIVDQPINKKRVVILEDLHTSLEHSIANRQPKKLKQRLKNVVNKNHKSVNLYQDACEFINPFSLLLSVEKVVNGTLNKNQLLSSIEKSCPNHKLFHLIEHVTINCIKADSIKVYRRALLPDYCYKCGSNQFDHLTLQCASCGEDGYKYADSISIAVSYN